ncbi:MAG: GGDEF domain-containing protein [Xanthobacteraceae bacterium]|nr:GGDEF domain-containing protein [Xanthobacteraceae bacterium]
MPREKPRNKRARQAKRGVAAPRERTQSAPVPASLAAEIERLREELKRSESRIEALEKSAHEDLLTGLLNRRGFERAFAQAIAYLKRYGGSAALLYLDLDRFKPINDRYGHAVGDVVLQETARLLLGSVRASDIAARLGGDELALVLWNLDAGQMAAKQRRLEALIDGASFEVQGARLEVGVSIGGVMLSADDTLASALERADAAMYARKKERKAAR